MSRLTASAFLVAVFSTSTAATAQDFRVYTAVTRIGPARESRQVVARSLTLFHAGRVYDHMEEVGELVIFEPAHDRFLLIRDGLGTEVSLSELRKMLEVAARAANEYILELEQRTGTQSQKTIAQLRFQLEPRFDPQFDPASQRLTMNGGEFRYHVQCAAPEAADILATYVQYADWMARLNTVLHSQGTFPAPREALNRELLQRGLLPVSVTLEAGGPEEFQLQAEHEFRWRLQDIDRDLIHEWEQLRGSPDVQWVSFREYQHKLLAAARRGQ